MIKSYVNKQAYLADNLPTNESSILKTEDDNKIYYNGVNVITKYPTTGDAVYHDGTKCVFFKGGDQLIPSEIPNTYTLVGVVEGWIGDKVLISNKDASNQKWLSVWKYAITAISSTSVTLKLRIMDSSKSGDARWGTAIDIPVTLTSTEINATSASEMSAAIKAKATEMGDTNNWWAYFDETINRIIVQVDNTSNYQQYQVAATGCTIALDVWGDMPAVNTLWRKSGVSKSWGGMNKVKFIAYYSTNGKTPTADYDIDTTDPIKRACFEDSTNSGYQYCNAIRNAFATYEDYMESLMVMYPQKYGVFALPDGKTLCDKYWNIMIRKEDNTEIPLYPALYYGHNVTTYNGIDGISLGDWFLPGVKEGMLMMNDNIIDVVKTTAAKVGATQINNSTHRWFSQRYSTDGAWIFNSGSGNLLNNLVNGRFSVQAVVLLKP